MEIKGKWFNEKNVTSIEFNIGWRYGKHPYYYRLFRKKHWILAKFSWLFPDKFDGFDYWSAPHVDVNLGKDTVNIICASNQEAREITERIKQAVENA